MSGAAGAAASVASGASSVIPGLNVVSGIGSAANAAVSLTEYLLGTQTQTDSLTSGQSSQSNGASTDVSDTTTTSADWNQIVTNFVNSITNTSTTTTNSADPGVIAATQQLANTALANANNPAQTANLIAGILQTANDALTGVFGTQQQAGGYNGSAAASQANDTLARATADAASAVLGYQTTEQGIASDALTKLLAATATQTVNTSSDTATTNTTDTEYEGATTVTDDSSTNVTGYNDINSYSNTQSSSKSGMSLVCTWMVKHGYISREWYVVVNKDFREKGYYPKVAYLYLASYLVSQLEKDAQSWVSRIILSVFWHRTAYVCAGYSCKNARRSYVGAAAVLLVAACCTPVGIALYTNDIFRREITRVKKFFNYAV